MKKITYILLLCLIFITFGFPKAEASSFTNADKAFYLGTQIAIAFENAYRGLKPSSESNYSYSDTTYYSYIGDKLSSSSSTKFGTTYYSYIGNKLSSITNYNSGNYSCSYIGDKISSCSNYSSLGTTYFNFIGNKLSSSSNYSNSVTAYYSYIGNTLSSIYSYDCGTYYVTANSVPTYVATPTASPRDGIYNSSQFVTLSTSTSGSTIHYTTNGFTPSSYSATYYSSILISKNTTLKAIAIKSGISDSSVMSEIYTINVGSQTTGGTQNNTSNTQVTTDTSTLSYSISKKAKKRIAYTFTNLSLTKKKWVKVRLNGRKVTTARVKRNGNNSIVAISFKYKKWAVGNYNLSMTYKNQIKIPYTTKKGKTKYRKGWESGSVTSENILSII